MPRRQTNAAARKQGRFLSRLWLKITNRSRPIAGHDIHALRGSPLKGSGDFDKGNR